jgi:protein subunit release factor A
MNSLRTLTDDQLLAQCRRETFRGPGPGGQKRNKTSSAVRLTHERTGISVIAGESRSQQRNREVALKRLRHKIALEIREPIDPQRSFNAKTLDISQKSDAYPAALGQVLDHLADAKWSVSDTAKSLGITTAKLSSFLRADEKCWAHVNTQRQSAGLRKLIG